jgi:hypothetical protein
MDSVDLDSSVECIKAIEAIEAMLAGETDPRCAFLRGQVVKHVWHLGLKNNEHDARWRLVQEAHEARWYLNRLIDHLDRAGH